MENILYFGWFTPERTSQADLDAIALTGEWSRLYSLLKFNNTTLATGDLDNGPGIILIPLSDSAWDRFNPTINPCRRTPELNNILAAMRRVEDRCNNHEINITPMMRLANCV
jgi:hypothetical protein